jgi:DNA adenine methylase
MSEPSTEAEPAQFTASFTLKGAARAALETTPAERLRELFADAVATVVAKASAPAPVEEPPTGPEIVWRRAIIGKSATAEERYVLGVVMEPESEDTQGDVSSDADIKKAQQGFMEAYADGYGDKTAQRGHMGKMHKSVVDGKVVILESWIQREDTIIEEEAVKKGTWLQAVRVKDDDMWEAVKKGDLTGFSIGGVATRIKEKRAA